MAVGVVVWGGGFGDGLRKIQTNALGFTDWFAQVHWGWFERVHRGLWIVSKSALGLCDGFRLQNLGGLRFWGLGFDLKICCDFLGCFGWCFWVGFLVVTEVLEPWF